jgi:tetratricopeptide (TPR) repeat protein
MRIKTIMTTITNNIIFEAIIYFDKSLSIRPNYTTALANKGIILESLGRNNESIAYFDKVLAIDPNDVDSLNGIGVAPANLGKYYEAIKYIDKALTIKLC